MIVEKDEENEEWESIQEKNASLCHEEGVQMLFAAIDHEWSSRLGDGKIMLGIFLKR